MKQITNENRVWHLIDLDGLTLGRAATEIANLLQGKSKIEFVRNADNGDYVVVINCSKFVITGNKSDQKMYRKHTGYIGNLKEVSFKELLEKSPDKIVYNAVYGMLPKNKLRDKMLERLKIYATSEHPHVNIKFEQKGK